MRPCFPILGSLLLLSACSDGRTGTEDPGAGDGGRAGTDAGESRTDAGEQTATDAGPGSDGCSDRARWIYLLDGDGTLIRFEPDTSTLVDIGRVSCPAGGATPFSMSVDRDATAWVLFTDGSLYRVSTADASCTATSFERNQAGLEVFGMGFVSDAEGSDAETLFVAGGARSGLGLGDARLGSLDVAGLSLAPIGSTLDGWPELTGTGAGELYAFFPDTRPPSVQQLDKTNGETVRTFPLESVQILVPEAWAFAFWGGRFYVFVKDALTPSTSVYRLDPSDGSVTEALPDSGRRIVGAGVSTCAPVVLI